MASCTCAVEQLRPRDTVPNCAVHGRRSTTADAGGIPVVDLTASANALLHRAEWLRIEALNLIQTAVTMRAHADQLEELVATLQGASGA